MTRGRPRIRTDEYWREYRRRKSSEWYRRQAKREELDHYKLERGCDRCGYREHAAALRFTHYDEGCRLFCNNCRASLHQKPSHCYHSVQELMRQLPVGEQ